MKKPQKNHSEMGTEQIVSPDSRDFASLNLRYAGVAQTNYKTKSLVSKAIASQARDKAKSSVSEANGLHYSTHPNKEDKNMKRIFVILLILVLIIGT